MPIYGVRITHVGYLALKQDTKVFQALSLQKKLILAMSSSRTHWTRTEEVMHKLESLNNETFEYNDAMLIDNFRSLEAADLIEIARYKSPTGQFDKAAPVGMVFR